MSRDSISTLVSRIKSEAGILLEKSVQIIIERHMRDILKENEDLRRRLDWLEDAVDQSNLEEIFVEYQKSFDIECWSGDAT